MSIGSVLQTQGLGKRYRRLWALADCTLSIPGGHVVGLVGPNGAGKSTLLNLAVGLLAPTAGTIEVLGSPPAAGPAELGRIGYLAQDAPVYAGLSVADHLRLGAHLNPGWDADLAREYLSVALLLSPADEVFARPGVAERVMRLGAHAPRYPLPGPSRRTGAARTS